MKGVVATDWDAYYGRPYKTANFSRKITIGRVKGLVDRYVVPRAGARIGELGGGNSIFFDTLTEQLQPSEYHVFDNNQLGLEKLRERVGGAVLLHNCDLLGGGGSQQLDFVYSIGLIEHFGVADTAKMIRVHFDLLAPGGVALITYPTPTPLYRATRACSEALGLWVFHDERPLLASEVSPEVARYGEILHMEIIWPIFLTQGVVVARKLA